MTKQKLKGLNGHSVRDAHGLSRAQNAVIDQWVTVELRFGEKNRKP